MQKIKHLFMTYRNGIVADSLRKAGMPYGIIFGLQLPQIKAIAAELKSISSEEELADLGERLHADRNVRESRLLAMAVYPPKRVTLEKAHEWLKDVLTREEADLLPFLLLRYTPYIHELLGSPEEFPGDSSTPLRHYALEALSRFNQQ